MPQLQQVTLKSFTDEKSVIINTIGSSNNLDEFDSALRKAKAVFQKNKESNAIVLEKNKVLGSPVNAENEKIYQQYKKTLAKGNAEATLQTAHSQIDSLKNHNYHFDYPKTIKIRKGKIDGKPKATLTIKSKDFKDIRPQNFSHANKDLLLEYNGWNISITNKTNQYITIEMISLYHRSSVKSVGADNAKGYREIPPNTTITVSAGNFDIGTLLDDYYGLTAKKAKSTAIDFGFATKYYIGKNNDRRTLYKKKSYNLLGLLKEQYNYL